MAETLPATQENERTILSALQPIRDLAKNWDIDIAGCLDEYLEEFELSTQARERVVTKLNFAQAALVLQSSSSVYSRKVDYLHSFTFRVQNELIGQEKKRNKPSRQTGIDEAVELFLNFDPNQDFLPLDDVIPVAEASKINLRDVKNHSGEKRRLSLHTSSRRLSLTSRAASSSFAQQHAERLQLQEGLRLINTPLGADGALYIPGTKPSEISSVAVEDVDQRVEDAQEVPIQEPETGLPMDVGGGEDYGDDDHDDGPAFDMNMDHDDVTGDDLQDDSKRVTFAEEPKKEDPIPISIDPWAMLDPHDASGTHRPLRVGKTIRLPSHLIRLPSEGSFPAPPPPPRQEPERNIDKRPVPLTGGLLFGNEFAYMAKQKAKRKAEERRLNREQAAAVQETPDDTTTLGDAFDDGVDDYGDDNDDCGDGFEMAGGPVETNTGMVMTNDFYNEPEADEDNTLSVHEICRRHVAAMAKEAEQYAVETELSTRVQQWHDRILPHLQAEEERPAFDIHAYGETVLESARGRQHLQFADVVQGCPSYEVSRRFLATLSLCNSGNVRFTGGEGLSMEVLDGELQRPMETYLAPSAETQ